ncbi:hypothetical protein FHL15_007865 [Xylaria flabelliformis]|uniref:Uncharacterized protein n=1 Tax=Xylaria flabelliformis TaxID=2512241 RepID=A0A553HTI4_9PEZI|nr:hypothetical protein FHL15_007865 [Xylaria flabelliformis]
MDRPILPNKPTLPQDILLLICQELGARREFTTLYRCSLVSRRVASIAVEQLYSILEVMDPFIDGRHRTARLWKSIVLSSRDATLYPYCAYMRVLSLGSLVECLDDIRVDSSLVDFFFDGPMQHFLVFKDVSRPRPPPLDIAAVVSRCADSITQYIKTLANVNGTSIALTHLEASIFPRESLPIWIRRLGALRSLQLQDGSVLGSEAASAISESCPHFSELTCFYCFSNTAAEDMAALFLALRPNSLQEFKVLSRSTLGDVTLTALNTHANSLRVLHLRNLRQSAFENLHLLSECTALESLIIEKDFTDRSGLDAARWKQVAKWISSCKALKELNFHHVLDALPILNRVLQAPEIRLERLLINHFQSASQEITSATWDALGRQDRLEFLTIASQDGHLEGLMLSHHPELVASMCRLSRLVDLNLMQVCASSADICSIAAALPNLEELCFGGGVIDEEVLEPLSRLSRLVLLSINATTSFTFDSLMGFAQRLDPVTNRGIKVDLLSQSYVVRLNEEEESMLNGYFANTLNGRIMTSYIDDPDELHEGDFSDSD